ncbi:MAG: alpha/beta hydrolase [Coprobacillus sp.]
MLKKKKFWIILVSIILVIVLGVSAFAGNYLVNYALAVDENKRIGSMSEDYTGIQDTVAQKEYDNWVKTIDVKTWDLKNQEGLALKGYFYPAQSETHTYVLAVHGYTVDHRDIAPAIKPFVEKGYHVLTPDQRGRGESEGDFLSMGWREKNDVLEWIDKIIEYDAQAEIILYGESMGAATIMMACGEKLPAQVKLAIEDCGYTSAYAMFKDQLKERFGLPEIPFLPAAQLVGQLRYGFNFGDASAINQLKKATLPILFIHGNDDDYVPTYMGKELYESYKGEKQLLLVDGAGHGLSADVNPKLYYDTVFDFITKYKK